MEWLWTTLLLPMFVVTACGLSGLAVLAYAIDRGSRRC